MKFHEYTTEKARVVTAYKKERMRRELARVQRLSPRAVLNLKLESIIATYSTDLQVLMASTTEPDKALSVRATSGLAALKLTVTEIDWFDLGRPFYNVFPIVERLTANTKLDIPAARVSLPHNSLCFRFAKGHEPFGLKTALVRTGAVGDGSAKVFAHLCTYTAPNGKRMNLFDHILWTGCFTTTDGAVPNDRFYFSVNRPEIFSRPNGGAVTIEDVIMLATKKRVDEDQKAHVLFEKRTHFIGRLVVLASMLAAGNDLITPALLPGDEEKYAATTDAMARKWMEERAANIQGRGFDFGKSLQAKSETCPHWRNPHMALYWTGVGGSTPVLKLRQGSVVMPKHLTSVPTGFDCPLAEQEQAPKTEYVYFLRDPSQGLVKVGRTRRSIAERQQESSTFVPNGLTLLGYIETGDCVEMETRIHREQGHKRRANEFFELSAEEVRAILIAYGGTTTEHLE